MIHIYTGDGKGKTTAALGLAVRAAGAGKRVAIIYFDKGGSRYSERKTLRLLKPAVRFFVTGKPRADFRPGGRFRFENNEGDLAEARRGLKLAGRTIVSGKFDVVILDEAITAIKTNLLQKGEVLGLICSKPESLELVLTGRGCPPEVAERADLISEIREVKHYFRQGVGAREGVDY